MPTEFTAQLQSHKMAFDAFGGWHETPQFYAIKASSRLSLEPVTDHIF
jgi:hypothetical protein